MNFFSLFCLFAFTLILALSPPSVNVALSDPVYPFIRQMTEKYHIPVKGIGSRPYTRKKVALFLFETEKRVSEGKISLTRVETQAQAYFRREFSGEFRLFMPELSYGERHIHRFQDTLRGDEIVVDLGIKDSLSYFGVDGQKIMSGILTGQVRGTIRNTLAYQVHTEIASEINSQKVYPPHDYNPVNGYPYNTFGETAGPTDKKSWDTFITGLFFENRLGTFELGVDRFQWGPGQFNFLTQSGAGPPVGLLKAEVDLWKLHYVHTINVIMGEKYRDKFMYAHRLEWALPLRFNLGINEVIIYGDGTDDGDSTEASTQWDERRKKRAFDPIYAIPFVPYFLAEHYRGDRDNVALGFDVSTGAFPYTLLYLELFLDDLISPLSFFDDHWSNKWAVTLGARYYLPVLYPDISFYLEYTRVEPWVYTHFFGESHRYRHYGQSLGTQVGPNGDLLHFSFVVSPKRQLRFEIFSENSRKGNGEPGDSITDVHLLGKNAKKRFLGKNVTHQLSAGFDIRYEVSRLINLRTRFSQNFYGTPTGTFFGVIDLFW